MDSVTHMAEIMEHILNEQADELSRSTGFIKRQRAFSGADIAQGLILGYLQEPQVSTEGPTQILQRRQVSLSAPGPLPTLHRAGGRLLPWLTATAERVSVAEGGGGDPLLQRFSGSICN